MPLYLIILLLSLSSSVLAETSEEPSPDRWYDIEVLIFTQQAGQSEVGDHQEVWPLDPGSPELKQVIELAPAPLDDTSELMLPFALRPQAAWRLADEDKKIRAKRDYTLISHLAWRQPAAPTEVALPVHIKVMKPTATADEAPRETLPEAVSEVAPGGVEQAADHVDTSLIEPPPHEPSLPDAAETSMESVTETPVAAPMPNPMLEGTIRVSRNHYLHIDSDLIYRPEISSGDGLSAAPEPETSIEMPPTLPPLTGGADSFLNMNGEDEQVAPTDYRMRQSRRVKKGHLNFFDHPRFGLLIRVDAVEQKTDMAPGE